MPVLVPELDGRNAGMLFEKAGEIRLVLEIKLQGNCRNGFSRLDKISFSFRDKLVVYKAAGGTSRHFFDRVVQIMRVYKK